MRVSARAPCARGARAARPGEDSEGQSAKWRGPAPRRTLFLGNRPAWRAPSTSSRGCALRKARRPPSCETGPHRSSPGGGRGARSRPERSCARRVSRDRRRAGSRSRGRRVFRRSVGQPRRTLTLVQPGIPPRALQSRRPAWAPLPGEALPAEAASKAGVTGGVADSRAPLLAAAAFAAPAAAGARDRHRAPVAIAEITVSNSAAIA